MTWGLANIIAALGAVTLVSACAPDRPGKPSQTGAPTFVSLNPCLDAILVEVAEPEQILAISHYSHQPGGSSLDREVALGFAATGGTAEEIIALEPDIVLASAFIAPASKAALERAGLRVETFGSPQTVAQSVAQVQRMGHLTGANGAASQLARAIAEPRWPLDDAPEPGPIWQPDPAPSVLLWQAGQIVAGQDTLIAQLLREEGFVSHSAAMGLGQADYVTLEHVMSDPPDVLLVAGSSAGQRHRALFELEKTWVRTFDPALFYCGGPSILDARDELHGLRLSLAGLRG